MCECYWGSGVLPAGGLNVRLLLIALNIILNALYRVVLSDSMILKVGQLSPMAIATWNTSKARGFSNGLYHTQSEFPEELHGKYSNHDRVGNNILYRTMVCRAWERVLSDKHMWAEFRDLLGYPSIHICSGGSDDSERKPWHHDHLVFESGSVQSCTEQSKRHAYCYPPVVSWP